jgi:uncharacterized protein
MAKHKAAARRVKTADSVPLAAQRFAEIAGVTFNGRRDTFRALGYKKVIQPQDYRARFNRNEVANRVIKALPDATWRGGGEVWEDSDPDTYTDFEVAFDDLNDKFKLWPLFKRADVLSRLGRYAIILIGAPGDLDQPLTGPIALDDIAYFQPYAEEDAPIQRYEADRKNPRYGLPLFYTVTRSLIAQQGGSSNGNRFAAGKALPVHYTRVQHLSDSLLDDLIFGEPALRCIWNVLDDIEKIRGGGAEAFWKRADQGLQVDIDPLMKLKDGEIEQIKKDVDEYVNGLKRVMRTRGIKINPLGSDVANFDSQIKSLVGLISAGTGIPQRILLGSEQAKLAAEQDGDNWDERVLVRREEYADPCVVHPFIDWMVRLGVLPEPEQYETKWALAKQANVAEQAEIAKAMAAVNQTAGETIFSADEIREVMDYDTQEEVGIEPEPIEPVAPPVATPPKPGAPAPKAASARKGSASYAHVHKAADRFRTAHQGRRQAGVPLRQTTCEQRTTHHRARGQERG